MSNTYELIKDRLGMGKDNITTLQEKTQRIAILSCFIARKVAKTQPLNMSETELQDAAMISRTVHPENEGIYNGAEPFDPAKNKARGDYSLKVAAERGIELSEVQKAAIKGDSNLIETRIIKLAETIIAVQYPRIQRGEEKKPITNSTDIITELLSDDRIDTELVKGIVTEQSLEQLINSEQKAFSHENEPKITTPKKPGTDEIDI